VLDGYTLIAVYSYLSPFNGDDLNNQGCNYVQECIDWQYLDKKNYIGETNYTLPLIGYRLATAYKWSQ